ncbi:MAG: MalY/PatB family protein [Candidatus Cryptobacteroides sp.]|jgi:cystathionine beta-lyase
MYDIDFDRPVSRRHTNSVKWDACLPLSREEAAGAASAWEKAGGIGDWKDDVLPMWVADMDFRVAQPIIDVLHRRVEHGVFGYTHVPNEYFEASIDWWQRRRGWKTERDWYLPIPGLVPAMSVVIKALTQFEVRPYGKVAERPKVIIQTPAYNCFFTSVRNNDCELVENRLIYDTEGDQPTWYLNFEDLERKAADPMAKILLFCNPHNPCGRVWPREDLERVDAICRRHGVVVVSDEIHCDLEMPGYRFTPMASLSSLAQDNTITLNSPTKAFNIAGLEISNIVTNVSDWRKLIDKVIKINELRGLNPFGILALQAAYREGEPWLDALKAYLFDNYRALLDFFEDELPAFPVSKLEATYLVWVDVKSLKLPSDAIERSLIVEEHVWVNSGTLYGLDGFLRINIACPRTTLLQGLGRIAKGLKRLAAR